MIAKFLSYFIPINVYKKNSAVSKTLEVTWNNGELVLDSMNTNYSYGSLQRILRKGLKYIVVIEGERTGKNLHLHISIGGFLAGFRFNQLDGHIKQAKALKSPKKIFMGK